MRLAMRGDAFEQVHAAATGPDNELPQPLVGIRSASAIERRKAFIVMIVSAQCHIDAALCELTPQVSYSWFGLVWAGTERRGMEISQHAVAGVCLQVVGQPPALRRAGADGNGAIERDEVPCAQVEAVIATARRTGAFPEIPEISRGVARPVIVISRGGPCAFQMASPCRAITLLELLRRP